MWDEFDDVDVRLENTAAVSTTASVSSTNLVVGAVAAAIVIGSAWLPWIVVRLPGSSTTHFYDFTTGGGATLFYWLCVLPIVGGAIGWVAKSRIALLISATASSAMAVLAIVVIASMSSISGFIPNIGILGTELATGRISPGVGASACLIACVVLGTVAILEASELFGISLNAHFPYQQLLIIGGLAITELASHVPWSSIRFTDVGPTVEVSGDGLVGSFVIQFLGWAAMLLWLCAFVTRNRRVWMIASILSLVVASGRLVYVVILWLGTGIAHRVVPDSVGDVVQSHLEPGIFTTLAMVLGVYVLVILDLVGDRQS